MLVALALTRRLLEDVNVDLEVMSMDRVHILEVDRPERRITPLDASDLEILDVTHLKQLWATVLVLVVPLTLPPVIAKAVDQARALNSKVRAILELEKTKNVLFILEVRLLWL